MRKFMTREVTTSSVKMAKMEMVDGLPQAVTLPDEIFLGSLTLEQAQKQVNKKHGQGVTVFEVNPETKIYKLSVEKFIEIAEEVEESEDEQAEFELVEE